MGKSSGKTSQTTTPNVPQAYLNAYQGAGYQGLSALQGNPRAVQAMMNPYQQQVVDANNLQWQKTNQQTMNALDGQATQAGAFGGSRAAVAQGAALAGNNLAQQQQNAGLLYSGYNGAMDRAQQLAQDSLSAPYGSTTTQTQTPGKNVFSGILGGASAGSAFGPWGAGIGAGIGLLQSL